MRIYFGWISGDRWAAVDDPRVFYAECPYLYRIQLVSQIPAGTDSTDYDPCKDFLEDFIPVMKDYLVDCSDGR